MYAAVGTTSAAGVAYQEPLLPGTWHASVQTVTAVGGLTGSLMWTRVSCAAPSTQQSRWVLPLEAEVRRTLGQARCTAISGVLFAGRHVQAHAFCSIPAASNNPSFYMLDLRQKLMSCIMHTQLYAMSCCAGAACWWDVQWRAGHMGPQQRGS